MARKLPVVRVISWPAVLLQLVFFAMLFAFAYWVLRLSFWPAYLGSAAAILILLVIRRRIFAHDQHVGLKLMRTGRFAEAVEPLQRSLSFFEEHPSIDRYRALVIGSASRMSFRELALCNLAYTHGQLGNGAESRRLYEQVVREYPDNVLARGALNLMNAASSASTTSS
ncbi:MAG TPA: tetratricopeptide repeat protein [Thermoanaerobaculia bacterium]